MVNFHDPKVVANDLLAATKLWHAFDGLFVWEFVTTLDYEWSIIRGRRPYRWTIWLYSIARVSTLAAIMLIIIGQDVRTPYNCQIAISVQLAFACLAFATAMLLIVLRIIAIWERRKIVVWISFGLWVNNIAFLIECAAKIRSVKAPVLLTCIVTNIEDSKLGLLVTIVTDIVLLLIMVVGLLYLHRYGDGRFGLAGLLRKQGVFWLLLAVVTEIPPGVLIILNLNVPLNVILQPPTAIIMIIAATRMHRSLTDFARGSTDMYNKWDTSGSVQKRGFPLSKVKRTPAARTSPGQMEVAFHVPCEEYLTQTSHPDSCVGMDGEPHGQPDKPTMAYKPESGIEEGSPIVQAAI